MHKAQQNNAQEHVEPQHVTRQSVQSNKRAELFEESPRRPESHALQLFTQLELCCFALPPYAKLDE